MEKTKEESSNNETMTNEDNKESENIINYKTEISPKKRYRYRGGGYRGRVQQPPIRINNIKEHNQRNYQNYNSNNNEQSRAKEEKQLKKIKHMFYKK